MRILAIDSALLHAQYARLKFRLERLIVGTIASYRYVRFAALLTGLLGGGQGLFGLTPGKSLTQYTRTVWTQAQGLPQDSVRAITQTSDSYLWLGTDEGLARFDGYEFVVFTKNDAALPSNSITSLWPAPDGGLWIGTPNGLVLRRNGKFQTFTKKDGMPDNAVTYLRGDHAGTLWIVAGGFLCRFENGKFTTIPPDRLRPVSVVRAVYEDREHQLWIAGGNGLVKHSGDNFSAALSAEVMLGNAVTSMLEDRNRDLWIAGSKGVMVLRHDGAVENFDSGSGLPNNLVRALWEDRSGSVWAGTDEGLSRFDGHRFEPPADEKTNDRDWVKCLFEDREGNLWVGMESGLHRFRDDPFSTYGRPQGLPSDAPLAVHQDRGGQMWIGYHDVGLVKLLPQGYRAYTMQDGLAGDEVFRIRESRNGDLLIATRSGFSRMHQGKFTTYSFEDPLARYPVYDAVETVRGRLLVAKATGVHEAVGGGWRSVIPGGLVVNSYPIVLSEGNDGSIWAGTYGDGLWQLPAGETTPRLWTTAHGLSSNQIRSLYQDQDGTLWIGTFSGGLNAFRNGVFSAYTTRDGLLSDNIAHVEDDGKGNLWLSTTRGICRVAKQQLRDFSAGRIQILTPENYSVEDGLRSAQSAPGYPTGGGGTKTRDGRLWFCTSRGLATVDPNDLTRHIPPPSVQMVDVDVDGQAVDLSAIRKLEPGARRIQFRYAGIHLSAPEQTRYAYKLEGLDNEWVTAGTRRVVSYDTLKHGQYRFVVRALLPAGVVSESAFPFEVLPHFYERTWFVWLCAAVLLVLVYLVYQLRLAQVHGRFSLVLEERMRLAREIHDTLAQGFVGIGSQLDAVTHTLEDDPETARQHLDVARKMASHSLTEARRSVMDLRAVDLDEQDLKTVLLSSAQRWVAGTPVRVDVEVSGETPGLPQEMKQHLVRIAQEAVANTLKHASAKMIWVKLEIASRRLRMSIKDDGRGFEPDGALSGIDGHFGLLGMRERAQRLGGEFDLTSHPGEGTVVQVTVPLPA